MKKKIKSLNLENETIELLQKRADKNGRSVSSEANRILNKELTKK